MTYVLESIVLLVVTMCVCVLNGRGQALQIQVSPETTNTINTNVVTITCSPDPKIDQEAQEIVILQVARADNKPIALLRQGSEKILRYGADLNHGDYQVDGQIDKMPSKSFLRLSMLAPKAKDKGLYKCIIFYLDRHGVLKENRSVKNVTFVDPVETKQLVNKLINRMTKLETEMKDRTNEVATLRRQLYKQTEDHMQLELNLLTNISMLEDKFKTQMSKKNYLSAFSAFYSNKRREEKGDTIIFNDITMRIGEEYDSRTGLFTAKKAGVYGFHLTAMLMNGNGWLDMGVYVNEHLAASLSAGSGAIWDQSSISVFVTLRPNDVVKVAVLGRDKGSLRHDKYTFFTGYLFREIGDITTI